MNDDVTLIAGCVIKPPYEQVSEIKICSICPLFCVLSSEKQKTEKTNNFTNLGSKQVDGGKPFRVPLTEEASVPMTDPCLQNDP